MYREISHSGWGSTRYNFNWAKTAGFLNKEIVNKYKELCEKNKDNKIQDNSVIYSSPLSNYPVYKLKNYIQENKLNIKKARKWDKIDTIIIDKDILNFSETEKNKKYILIPAKEILDSKNKYIGKDNYAYERNNKFQDTLFFYINEDLPITHYHEFEQFKNYPKIEGFPVINHHGMKRICDNLDFLIELFDNIEKYNINVVLDSSIDKEINKDTVIDLEIYENLYSMLNSSDKGNHKLAREIIANCEYDQSRPYILFLTSIFSTLMNKSDNKNYHAVHKNLNKDRSYFKWSYRGEHFDMVKLILEKCPEYRQIFSQCMKIHINSLYKFDLVKEIISV
jgi:hypothetical protein